MNVIVEFPKHFYEDDHLIVNYKDACIYGRDWKLFSMMCHPGDNDGWLNDSCIHYQLLRLQDQFAATSLVLLLEPAVTSFFVHQCIDDDEMEEFATAHQLHQKNRFLIPIHDLMRNDDDATASASWRIPGRGTHWSLLALIVCEAEVPMDDHQNHSISKICGYHLDSVPNSGNRKAAECVANKLGTLVLQQQHTITVQECPVPKQRNGHDCGIHVLMTVECILEIWTKEEEPDGAKEASNLHHHRNNNNNNNKSNQVFAWTETIGRNLESLLHANPNFCRQFRMRIARDILDQASILSNAVQQP
jgi:hypothetical protein